MEGFLPLIHAVGASKGQTPRKRELSNLSISTIVLPILKQHLEKHFCTKTAANSSLKCHLHKWFLPLQFFLQPDICNTETLVQSGKLPTKATKTRQPHHWGRRFMLEEHFSCTVHSLTASVILLFIQKLGILSSFILIMHFIECCERL